MYRMTISLHFILTLSRKNNINIYYYIINILFIVFSNFSRIIISIFVITYTYKKNSNRKSEFFFRIYYFKICRYDFSLYRLVGVLSY